MQGIYARVLDAASNLTSRLSVDVRHDSQIQTLLRIDVRWIETHSIRVRQTISPAHQLALLLRTRQVAAVVPSRVRVERAFLFIATQT